MSWLNLNQSLNSLKGQISNFATEVLSEGVAQSNSDEVTKTESSVKDLEDKCRQQELEITTLKNFNEELQATLQSERLSRQNGIKEEESSWSWNPIPQAPEAFNHEMEKQYKLQIQALQNELSNMRDRGVSDQRVDNDEELNRLREENKNLTCSLDDLDNQHQIAMEKLLTLKKELQKNFEILKKEHEELKSSNDEYTAEIKLLLHKIGERDQEIEVLKSIQPDYDTLHHKYQNLERIHSLLRENAEKFQEENQELHEEVFKLQEQVTKLEHDLEISTKHNEALNTVPKEKYDELLKEITELKHRRDSSQIHLDEINIDDNAKSVIETLKRDINELKHKLAQKESDNNNSTEIKSLKPDKVMQLYNRYVNFDLPVDYVGEMPTGTENVVMQKLENAFKTLNNFKKEIDVLEQKLSEKNLNINHLQTQIDDLTTENEYLTSDIQHLESELEEMKKNNDFLISEIAALKNTSKLEPIIETHEDNLVKLESELADCNRINKTFESEIKRIEKELKEVQIEKKILQESLNDMKNKYTSMLNELKICKTQTEAVKQLENTTSLNHDTKHQEMIDELDDLKKHLNSANSKNEQLSIDIHIVENDKVLLKKQVDDLQKEIQAKNNSCKEIESLKINLEHKLKDAQNRTNEIIKVKEMLEKENITLKQRIEDSSISTVTTDVNKITSEKDEIASKLQQLVEENQALEKQVKLLSNEIEDLKHHQEELITENNQLKEKCLVEARNINHLQETLNELQVKSNQFDIINNELSTAKEENKALLQKKVQLELELSTTDSKIVQLEEEFEKLVTDLNEKDALIDSLNKTVNKNNIDISNLNQNVADLDKSNQIKNEEIEYLRHSLDEVTQKLNNTNLTSNRTQEELDKLHTEKEELNKHIYELNDAINIKHSQISTLNNQLQEIEKSHAESKLLIESKDKEIKELTQSIVELTDKIKASENTTLCNELKQDLDLKEMELVETKNRANALANTCVEYKAEIDELIAEKTELINLVNLKHNESIQYHNEIQRLNHVLLEQTNEFRRIIEEKDILIKNCSNSCSTCENLRQSLKEKDQIIMNLNQNLSEHDRLKVELSNASDTVKNLTKRCEDLDKSLTIQLDIVKKLTAENVQLSEQEQNSSRELERLRHHLVEMEENYTQELMTSEQKLTECQTRLHQVEERAKQTSTVYTSNSIRANQEVETLRNQIKLLEKQREEVQARLSEAEDARSRSEAALTNLQVVLEQFQLDKERDIHAATEKVRNKMEDIKRHNEVLQQEILRLNGKLEESIAGLQAATRLGDQVETKTAQINDLKEQVRTLQTSVAAAEERYYNAISNQQDRVDKNLVKNLVINYVLTAGQSSLNRTQILRILSTVLDFNQKECEKLGLVKSSNTGDSLAAEFVKFLQNESKPRPQLPDMMGLQGGRASVSSSRKSSTIGPHPVFEIGHRRNPSTGSNNLLFQNLETMETASQVSVDSENRVIPINTLDTGINQTRNNEGAILKHVLKDM
ncbi:thyroid receptor-interacting protein 11-like [Melitaea cinxia]|uniref:thyroid receptor-interacting protein 11-like n=1 Tax=Melitaea cinxia TaxID=113334 RepID=UPI001E271401|nr:thyroid receptor-interacting protein 11-like [Melitaea cinxia]